jgi:hypothetical protein
VLTGRGYPRSVRRALRAAGALPSRWRRRQPPALPESLRDRLLAIPDSASARRSAVAPRKGPADLTAHWLLGSPLAAVAASFLVAMAATALLGDPYRVGATTLEELRGEMKPAAERLCERATRLADAVGSVGDVAIGALPRAGSAASRAIARTLDDGLDRGQPAPEHHRREALP